MKVCLAEDPGMGIRAKLHTEMRVQITAPGNPNKKYETLGMMRATLASGAEGGLGRRIDKINAGMGTPRYRLASYFYAKKLPEPAKSLRMLVDRDDHLIIDSGIYSFMFGSEQGTIPATYEAYRDYTREYLDDLTDWGLQCYVVESDTHRLLGMDATYRLREEFAPLGSRCIYVWHQPEGLDGLVKLARERDYIALGMIELRKMASGVDQGPKLFERMVADLLRRVHEACAGAPPRIHLLGCTIPRIMETRLAWSCDSTSWLSGLRFGNACIWTVGGGLETVGLRSERFARFVTQAEAAHPAAAAFAREQVNPSYYLACLACAYAYELYQHWLDSNYSPVPMRGDKLPGGPIGKAAKQAKRGRTGSAGRDRLGSS